MGGKCKKECGPPRCPDVTGWHVCGSDGKTYSNGCLFERASCKSDGKLTVDHFGKCGECNHFCGEIYSPVCGSDGKTHGNECGLNYASCMSEKSGSGEITVAHRGECGNALYAIALECAHGLRTFPEETFTEIEEMEECEPDKKWRYPVCKEIKKCKPDKKWKQKNWEREWDCMCDPTGKRVYCVECELLKKHFLN